MITRHDMQYARFTGDPEMREKEDGDYVLFSDHEKEVAALKADEESEERWAKHYSDLAQKFEKRLTVVCREKEALEQKLAVAAEELETMFFPLGSEHVNKRTVLNVIRKLRGES